MSRLRMKFGNYNTDLRLLAYLNIFHLFNGSVNLLSGIKARYPSKLFCQIERVLKAATKEGYYRINPREDLKAKSGKNKS